MKQKVWVRPPFILMIVLFITYTTEAQEVSIDDKIPLDIAYLRSSQLSKPAVKVVYGRPALKNEQEKLADKITYGTLWKPVEREVTEIKFYQAMYFGKTLVPPGTYGLLLVPGEKEWEIILNSQYETWGAFRYNPHANIAHLKITVKKGERLRVFSICFNEHKKKRTMVLGWDQTRIYIPIQAANECHVTKI
ncbi:DUF2911 domain-containing protein [Flavobacteriaceae bacterium F08102]|nr:DUF2911 domain-containing protein [Flavobacteriaceae bacterium F08102]